MNVSIIVGTDYAMYCVLLGPALRVRGFTHLWFNKEFKQKCVHAYININICYSATLESF